MEKIPIQNLIYEVRGYKVLLDSDLAELYEVEVKMLNRAVKRNLERFPSDFMFQLTWEEWDILRSQIVTTTPDSLKYQIGTSSSDNLRCQIGTAKSDNLKSQIATSKQGNLRSQIATAKRDISKVRFLPYVFTEQGVAMLSSVLSSPRAIEVNISIMRAFVNLRYYTITQSGPLEQIADLRHLLMLYIDKNDKRVNDIIIALNNLIKEPPKPSRIGFGVN